MKTGHVGPDGQSVTPEGIVDLSLGAEDIALNEEVAARLNKLFNTDLSSFKAKYKIEVAFTEERSHYRPFGGFVCAWTNGGFAHGGGDEAIYFCSGKHAERKVCGQPLEPKWLGSANALCPSCRQLIDVRTLTGQIWAKLSIQHWTRLIMSVWNRLESDADIRLGYFRGDLHAATERELIGHNEGEHLEVVRGSREWALYPLQNIVIDLGNGASLESRVRAFLTA